MTPMRHHRRAAVAFGDQDQRFDRRLPLLELLFGLRQLLDISGRVLKRDKLAAAGERDRIFELALPAPIANDANPSQSNSVLKLFGIRGAV
jgi:hypothetical protein